MSWGSRVLCNIDVDAGAGERKIVMVERYLVQLGVWRAGGNAEVRL